MLGATDREPSPAGPLRVCRCPVDQHGQCELDRVVLTTALTPALPSEQPDGLAVDGQQR